MLIDKYHEHVDALFKKVNDTQREKIIEAGKMMAETMMGGSDVHIFDTGHIINSEMTGRSGGLLAPRYLKYYLVTENPGRQRPAMEGKSRCMEGMAELVFNAGSICPGDLMIIGSVSGRNEQVVDLALTVKKHGCKLIVLTSMEYSSQVKSAHSSGKKLYEIADLVIDNCAPLGDGMMQVEGIPVPFAPASGLSAVYIMWQVYCCCAEELLAHGLTPTVYKSSNMPGGDEYNLEMEHRWAKLGY